jgi:hypothetical protein
MASRSALRARCRLATDPVVVACSAPSAQASIPAVSSVSQTCLYAPYECIRFRASAPHIWCSQCRVHAMSVWSQNGISAPPMSMFDPPRMCAMLQCAPPPTLLPYGVHPGGAACVAPIHLPHACPSTVLSCAAVDPNSRLCSPTCFQ